MKHRLAVATEVAAYSANPQGGTHMKRIALALALVLTLALGSVAQAGTTIRAVPGVTYQVIAGDVVSYGGTRIYVTSAGTITFCPCPNFEDHP